MRRSKWTGLSFLLPGFCGVAVFSLLPFMDVIRRSFVQAVSGRFCGLENYRVVLHNSAFLLAVKNTLRFLLVCLPLLLGISLVLAFLLHAWQMAFHQKLRLLKAAYLVPMAIPAASIVLLWKLMFDKHGFVNGILHLCGIHAIDWMNTGAAFFVLVSAEAKKNSDRNQAVARAKEDYRDSVRNNADAVRDAKKDAKDTKTRLRREQAQAYEKKLEELQTAVKEAKKAYDDALEQQKTEVQQAKRAIEDAAKTPVSDYSDTITQIEINQKQRELDAAQKKLDTLTKQKDEGQLDASDDQWENQYNTVQALKDELVTAKLQQQAKKDEASRQEADRRQTLARAQEDYENVVSKNEKLVREAEQKWKESKCKLQAFAQGEDEEPQDTSAAEDAQKAVKTAQKQQKQQNKAAKRALEDAAETEAKDNSAKINAVTIAQKQQQLATLQKVKASGGKVKAQMGGVVSSVQLTVGEKTTDTAAFLLADTSGGLRFTTQISKEDAVYVDTGDTVTLKAGDQTWEDMTVLSTETEKDHTVKVTVYVPKKTISLGANVSMELRKTSKEYPVTVPIAAIHSEKDKYFVYTMEKADTVLGGAYVAKKTNVTIAEKNGEYAAIKDGDLSSGDSVIVNSDAVLSAGEKVRLQES